MSATAEPPSQPAAARRGWLKPALLIVFGVAVGWLAWSLFTPVPGYERSLPDLTLERLEGGDLHFTSLTGEPAVVNLWATWCLPCLRELPMMANMMRREPGVRFVFADQGEQRAVVESYLAERPDMALEGVVLDRDQALSVEFQAPGLPITLFFDDAGNHVHSHIGELTEVELFNYLIDLKAGNLNPL